MDALFQAIFMEGPHATVLTRALDGSIVAVNAEWLSLTGFSQEEVVGRTTVDIGHWPDALAQAHALQPLMSSGKLRDLDVTMVFSGGVHRLVSLNAVLVDVQGESFIVYGLRDVTVERMSQAAARAGEQQ